MRSAEVDRTPQLPQYLRLIAGKRAATHRCGATRAFKIASLDRAFKHHPGVAPSKLDPLDAIRPIRLRDEDSGFVEFLIGGLQRGSNVHSMASIVLQYDLRSVH